MELKRYKAVKIDEEILADLDHILPHCRTYNKKIKELKRFYEVENPECLTQK